MLVLDEPFGLIAELFPVAHVNGVEIPTLIVKFRSGSEFGFGSRMKVGPDGSGAHSSLLRPQSASHLGRPRSHPESRRASGLLSRRVSPTARAGISARDHSLGRLKRSETSVTPDVNAAT